MIKFLARVTFFVLFIPFLLVGVLFDFMYPFLDKVYSVAYPVEHHENDNFFKFRRK